MQLFEPGETAVVTGAGNGIGQAIAQALVREGVDTVFAEVNANTVHEAVDTSAQGKGEAIAWVGNLAHRDECRRLYDDALKQLGHVDIFVHSASPPRREKDHLFGVDDETWREMHAVNVDAAFFLGREFARQMVEKSIKGRLLLLTSLHSITPRNLPHYSSAKGAMDMMVKEFARSLGQFGIRANAMLPGAIAAGGFVADPALAKHIPLGRLGVADDLAPMALAVLSNKVGGYVTGTNIVVDGGLALTNWFEPPSMDL